jgi:hypothetical protein
MTTQLQQFLLIASPFLFIWSAIWLRFLPGFDAYRLEILLGGPLAIVALLGLYAVFSVVHGVLSFNDCPEARAELIKEVEEAKKELRQRKIIS